MVGCFCISLTSLRVLAECERIGGIEDKARVEFPPGDDPVEVFKRHERL